MRVGLVLGAGGLSGLAFHAGALCAMERDLGWDARSADLVVGTSAGSVVGALLRSGVPASEIAALATGASSEMASHPVVRSCSDWTGRGWLPPLRGRDLLRAPRLPHPTLLASSVTRPWDLDVVATLMTLLHDGEVDLASHNGEIFAGEHAEWPEAPLWLCATRQRDSRRVVFGRDARPTLTEGVAASCAIPGYATPVPFAGDRYVDGGLRSATNADLAALHEPELDLVIVSSPMSGVDLGLVGPETWMRRFSHRRLQREVAALRSAELPTVVLEPGRGARSAMGLNFMDEGRMRAVVGASFLDVGEQLQARRARALVAGLATRRSERPQDRTAA